MEIYTLNLRIEICEDNGFLTQDTAQQAAMNTLVRLTETLRVAFDPQESRVSIEPSVLGVQITNNSEATL